MNRINKQGIELLQYKQELEQNYPELVKKSMYIALEQMVESDVIDLDTYTTIKNEDLDHSDFEEYLMQKRAFIKTHEEILAEFDIVRKELDDILETQNLTHLFTESLVDKDAISVTRKFTLGEDFTTDYFGVKEEDLLRLMKRKGFVEKFAVLRLTKILQDAQETLTYPKEWFTIDESLVYFDKDENGYSIDFVLEIPIEHIEDKTNHVAICEEVKKITRVVEEFYDTRMKV